jgi:hypothetical protein
MKQEAAVKGLIACPGAVTNCPSDDEDITEGTTSSKGSSKVDVGIVPCTITDESYIREFNDLELVIKKAEAQFDEENGDNDNDGPEFDAFAEVLENLKKLIFRFNNTNAARGFELAPELLANLNYLKKLKNNSLSLTELKINCFVDQRIQLLYYSFIGIYKKEISLAQVKEKFHGALIQIATALYVYFPIVRKKKGGLLCLFTLDAAIKKALSNNKSFKELNSSSAIIPSAQKFNEMLKSLLTYDADSEKARNKYYSTNLSEFFGSLIMWICYFFQRRSSMSIRDGDDEEDENIVEDEALTRTLGFFQNVAVGLKYKKNFAKNQDLYFQLFLATLLSGFVIMTHQCSSLYFI